MNDRDHDHLGASGRSPDEEPEEQPRPERLFPTSFRGYSTEDVDVAFSRLHAQLSELESQGDYLHKLNESLAAEVERLRAQESASAVETARLREELEEVRASLPSVEELRGRLEELREQYGSRVRALEFLIASGAREIASRLDRPRAHAPAAPGDTVQPVTEPDEPSTQEVEPRTDPDEPASIEPVPAEEVEDPPEAVADVRGAWAPPEPEGGGGA